jgi:hypothetical protein
LRLCIVELQFDKFETRASPRNEVDHVKRKALTAGRFCFASDPDFPMAWKHLKPAWSGLDHVLFIWIDT